MMKALVKSIPNLLSHSDKNVREEVRRKKLFLLEFGKSFKLLLHIR